MGKSACDCYFDIASVVESSALFEHGKAPFRVLKRWYYPASQIYKVRISGSQADIVFIKLLRNRNEDEIRKHQMLIENEYKALKLLREKCNTQEYGVAQPLECIKERLALITKEEEGERLDFRLLRFRPFSRDDRSQIERGMLYIGRWLRCFHEATKSEGKTWDVGTVVPGEIETHIKTLLNYDGKREWGEFPGALMGHVYDLIHSINGLEFKESLCHGDFIPANILQSRTGRIAVVDFSDSRRGIIYEDLARFWQWLDDLKIRRPWQKKRDIERMKTHFIRGFFAGEIPSKVLRIYLIKVNVERLAKLERMKPVGFLGNFRKERRIYYCKQALLRMSQGKVGMEEKIDEV